MRDLSLYGLTTSADHEGPLVIGVYEVVLGEEDVVYDRRIIVCCK
jgi:hypothetical protein